MPELGVKYKGKFVSCSERNNHINLRDDLNIQLISKNESVLLFHEDKVVGG
jgi:hypothetical protein